MYVTHDQTEALALSDRIAVLNKGIIQQTGIPDDIYYNPENKFVADFIGHANLFDSQLCRELFQIKIDSDETLAVLPEELIPLDKYDNISCKVIDVQFTGFSVEYAILFKDKIIRSLLPSKSLNNRFGIGEEVGLKIVSEKIRKVK